MQRTRLELAPGIILDARRAVWFEAERALAVADLHLGYAWAQRSRGAMLPLSAEDDTTARLSELVRDYGARELFVLGDIVQKAVPIEPVREPLRELCAQIGSLVKLRLLGGNHDRGLAALLSDCEISIEVEGAAQLGPHWLLHGDAALEVAADAGGRVFIGHEHPAIRVGDGVASMKCPCFLAGPRVVVLPAFSAWAAGSNVRQESFMSPLARAAEFREAYAILAHKLLPIRL
jgi:putative SbcD/Mre11-related phosphoesterase